MLRFMAGVEPPNEVILDLTDGKLPASLPDMTVNLTFRILKICFIISNCSRNVCLILGENVMFFPRIE